MNKAIALTLEFDGLVRELTVQGAVQTRKQGNYKSV